MHVIKSETQPYQKHEYQLIELPTCFVFKFVVERCLSQTSVDAYRFLNCINLSLNWILSVSPEIKIHASFFSQNEIALNNIMYVIEFATQPYQKHQLLLLELPPCFVFKA